MRYDRLDNFWFTLFHELGHVYLHLTGSSIYDFFDNDETTASDQFEIEADEFALNSLINPDDWAKCVSRISTTESTVKDDARRFNVGTSVVAGRIRREQSNYRKLNRLVGYGRVRNQFDQ